MIKRRNKIILSILPVFSLISLFSVGFASFLIPGGGFVSDKTDNFNFNIGKIEENIKGVYVDDSSFNGLRYTSDDSLNYYYSKTSLDIGIKINKTELKTNLDNSILTFELLTNNNFFNSVSYEDIFTLYFNFNPNITLNSNKISSITSGITANFYVKSDEFYDLDYFSNRYMVNQNEIDLTLNLNLTNLPNDYNFLSLYQNTTFTYRYNCGVI